MKSLQLKLTFIIALSIVVSCVINLFLGIYFSTEGIKETVRKDVVPLVQTAEKAFSNMLLLTRERIINVSYVVKSVMTGKDGKDDFTNAEIPVQQMAKDFGYASVAILDKDCNTLFEYADKDAMNTLNATPVPENVSSQSYVRRAFAGETVISTTEKTGEETVVIRLASPIAGTNDIVLATIDGQYFSTLFQEIRIGKTGNILMFDDTGSIIANIRPPLVYGRNNYIELGKTDKGSEAFGAVIQKAINGETGIGEYLFGGIARICSYMPVENADKGWAIMTAAPIEEMIVSADEVKLALIISSAALAIAGLALAIFTSRAISRPINLLCKRMKQFADGDLSTAIPAVNTKDEIRKLSESIGDACINLKRYIDNITMAVKRIDKGNLGGDFKIIRYHGDFAPIETSLKNILNNLGDSFERIHNSSDIVKKTSSELLSGVQDLADGSRTQSEVVEDFVSQIETISQQVTKNLEQAEKSDALVETTLENLQQSSEFMSQMSAAMNEIILRSDEIGKINKTIEDIAFQTNILALNAAVEAARSGEAGKGFAVVAGEVRNLAAKSTEASAQTIVLLDNARNAISEGTQISEKAVQSLNVVVENSQLLKESAGEIKLSAEEQNRSIEVIRDSISRVSDIIKHISTITEISEKDARQQQTASEELEKLISYYNLV
jgi:methyl-accepting chemotaxis protein